MCGPVTVDWTALANDLQTHMTTLAHHEAGWYGTELYAEALRRTFGYDARDGGGRKLPYDTVAASTGLTTAAEADYVRDSHTIVDRAGRETAEKALAEARAQFLAGMREAGQRLADHIRDRCDERRVPMRLRREGAMLAADWIDPRVPDAL
jgi:hypothetical protein